MRYRLIVVIYFFLFIFTIFSYTVASNPINRDIHIKSIITSAYIPKRLNMVYQNFTFPNGSLYQVSNHPNLFRNLLVVVDENISEQEPIYELLIKNPVTNLKTYQLTKVRSLLFAEQFSLSNLLYSNRWSYFLYSFLEPPYEKPTNLFGISESEWINFDEGWYYKDEPSKTVVIWTVYDQDAQTLQKIGNKLINMIFELFPYQETIYLENNQYLKENLDFSANIINALKFKNQSALYNDIENIDEKIVECLNRKSDYYENFEQMAFNIDPFYFSNDRMAFGFVTPMISDLNFDALSALKKNEENVANLQQSKNIIQNELSNRMNDETLRIAILTLYLTWIILIADIVFNIPKIFEKGKWWIHTPKLDFHMKSYTRKNGGLVQTPLISKKNSTSLEEYKLNVNDNPILGFEIRHVGKYLSYYIETVEVLAPPECNIEYYEIFAIRGERPFIKGAYTDIWHNMKIFMDIQIVKGQISDPTLLGFKLNYKFSKDETKTFTIKIRTSDCRKMFEKTFMIIGK